MYFLSILLARYQIWLAKTKDDHPNLTHFISTLKSQYEIEQKVEAQRNGNLLQDI